MKEVKKLEDLVPPEFFQRAIAYKAAEYDRLIEMKEDGLLERKVYIPIRRKAEITQTVQIGY